MIYTQCLYLLRNISFPHTLNFHQYEDKKRYYYFITDNFTLRQVKVLRMFLVSSIGFWKFYTHTHLYNLRKSILKIVKYLSR